VRLAADIGDSIRETTQLPVVESMPMERVLSGAVSSQRLNMLLMSAFGACALLLSAIGTYGVMAYSVELRVREIGIRMALGSDATQVARMFLRQGMVIAGVGVAVGLTTAFYMADLLGSFLFQVEPRDPVVFATVPVVVLIVALAAIWIPANRATRIVPLAALRCE
jgi:ABC-type antimicrobial peptide transport system permease subunit